MRIEPACVAIDDDGVRRKGVRVVVVTVGCVTVVECGVLVVTAGCELSAVELVTVVCGVPVV
jgi:hypothetical protein